MNKNVVIGIAALGGLVLIASLLLKTPEAQTPETVVTEKETTSSLQPAVSMNFPTYPHVSNISTSESTAEDGRVSYSLSLETTDPIQEINDWYRDALNTGGWNIKSDKNIGGYQIIQAERNNFFTSVQAANGENGSVTISQQAQIRPE